MSRRSSPFTQTDISRLIKGAIAGGLSMEQIIGIRVTKEGPELQFGERTRSEDNSSKNEWDEVLG